MADDLGVAARLWGGHAHRRLGLAAVTQAIELGELTVGGVGAREMVMLGWNGEGEGPASPIMRALRFTRGTRTTSVSLLPAGDQVVVQIMSLRIE